MLKIYAQSIKMTSKRYIHKSKKDRDTKTTFIILCSQKSNKRGYSNIPLLKTNSSEYLIDQQINVINNLYKNNEIIVISGFENEKLVSHIREKEYQTVRVLNNQNYKMTGALECWILGLNVSLAQDTYIIHGDRTFDESFLTNAKDTHTFVHDFNKNNYNLGILSEDNKLLNISYGLPNVWSEIFFISKEDFHTSRDLINDCKKRKLYSIDSFINALSQEIPISVFSKKGSNIKTLKEIEI